MRSNKREKKNGTIRKKSRLRSWGRIKDGGRGDAGQSAGG
jgi:hypothetical protein